MIERRATSPNDCLHDVAAHPPHRRSPSSLSSPLPALLNCDQHQRHHLSSTCLSVKSLGTKNYRPVEARTLMTRPHSATPPLSLPLLQCVILGLCCQKIIMPINFTHAGCSSPPAFPSPPRVLPTLSSAALVVNYTTKNYVCLLPAASGRAPAPTPLLLYVCVA